MNNRQITFISLFLVVSLLWINISCGGETKKSTEASQSGTSQSISPSPKASPSSSPQSKTPSKTSPSGSLQNVPVIVPENVGPPGLDLPGKTTDIRVSSKDGATFEKGGVSIVVPSRAFSKDGTISIKEFTEPPPPYTVKPGVDPLPMAISIGKVYDLGPEGTVFEKPVTVTLPYDKSLLDSGVDTSKITLVYYNGESWTAAGGLVDPDQGTVSASLTGFPGEIFTIAIITGLAVTIAVSWGIAGYNAYENYKADPVANGNARDYVTPNSSTVADYTHRAGSQAKVNGTYEWISMEDPNQPGQVSPDFIEYAKTGGPNTSNRITFNGSAKNAGTAPAYTHDYNWIKPDEYFNNGLKGDCTCITAAYLSMFRRLGIEAYGVDGNKSNAGQGQVRHSWVEFVLNGQPYYYDDDEGIKPLKDIEQYLLRPDGIKGQGFMWDEKGQKIYAKSWWGPANMARLQSCKSMEGQFHIKGVGTNTYSNMPGDTEEGAMTYSWTFDTINWADTSFSGLNIADYRGDTYLTVKGTVSPDGTQIVTMTVLESTDSSPGSCNYFKSELASVPLDFPKNVSQVLFSQTGPEVKKYFVNGKVDFCGHYDHSDGSWKEQRIGSLEWTDAAEIPNLQITFH